MSQCPPLERERDKLIEDLGFEITTRKKVTWLNQEAERGSGDYITGLGFLDPSITISFFSYQTLQTNLLMLLSPAL